MKLRQFVVICDRTMDMWNDPCNRYTHTWCAYASYRSAWHTFASETLLLLFLWMGFLKRQHFPRNFNNSLFAYQSMQLWHKRGRKTTACRLLFQCKQINACGVYVAVTVLKTINSFSIRFGCSIRFHCSMRALINPVQRKIASGWWLGSDRMTFIL